MQTLFAICLQKRNIYNKNGTKNTINMNVALFIIYSNINSIIDIISISNIARATSCGSGKKYKNCCGK